MSEVETTRVTNESDSELFTFELGPETSNAYQIPVVPTMEVDARWLPAGESLTVSELSIQGGMLYVGNSLGDNYWPQEPSLINPTLKVAKVDGHLEERLFPHWPNYQTITPAARRAYLQWLADGRRDPIADSGYVLLFFYGLERRALVDALTDPQACMEIPAIVEEVKRLLSLYGDNRTFRGYAESFLEYLNHPVVDSKLHLGPPPVIGGVSYKMPMSLLIGLGQLAANKQAVDADWALAWALADPHIARRTPMSRCREIFGTLFKLEYVRRHPAGLVLAQNKKKLKCIYRPASSVLSPQIISLTHLPDVTDTSVPRKKLQPIVDICSTELEPYSRYLERNPDNDEALEGLLLLPATLWPTPVRARLEDLQTRIGDDMIVMSFGELAGRFKSAGALSQDKVLALARTLESLQIGMEPDVLMRSKPPKPEDGALKATPAYNASSVKLDLASANASIDGDSSQENVILLSQQIDSWNHLSVAHRKRLKTHLAQVDGTISASEVKLLVRVYRALQLDTQLLYGDLHGAPASVSQSVSEPSAYNQRSSDNVQRSVPNSQGFVLNHERIAQLQQETAQVSALLAKVFTDEQVYEPADLKLIAESMQKFGVGMAGLDAQHSAFLRLIISRTEWSRTELEAAASDMELMLDGALEQINDMAFEHFDMPVTEGEEHVEINADILNKLAL